MNSLSKLFLCMCLVSAAFFPATLSADDSLAASKPGLKPIYVKIKKANLSSNTRFSLSTNPDPKGLGDDKGVPINFFGNFRFHGMYRNLYDPYPNAAGVRPKNLNISGFGDGSMPLAGSPLLTLNATITPAPGIDMGIGMGFNHIFAGTLDHDSTRSRSPFGQTFGAYANFKTGLGNIRIGGGNLFTGMTQLLSGWPQIRWNPFYRLPWDPSTQWGGSWNSYENTYKNGSVTNFDPAYASGGRTQGVILQLSDLPAGLGLNLSYGVTGQTGVYELANPVSLVGITKKTLGGRAIKKVNAHTFGVSGIINNGYVDNISGYKETQYMYTGDAYVVLNNFTVSAEVGSTQYTSPFGKYDGTTAGYGAPADTVHFESGTDLLAQVKVFIKKSAFGFPINLSFYHLGPNYINLNSGAFNTSTYNNASAYIQVNSQWDVSMRRGFIADINQSANNRRAVEISTQLERGRFIVSLGTQVGTEIEPTPVQNQVMFYHKLNPWSRAGFNYWTPIGGPYQKHLGNFIQLLERVPITDSVVDYKKTFNVFDIDARYKTSFLGRSLILTNYISYQSASDQFSPIPFFTEDAFVRVFYEELTAYYQLSKSVVFVGHGAYNKAVGNNRTQLSPENGKPINQNTWGFGAGIDWNFAPNMGLYFRELWMTHSDKNFKLDHFEGFETSLELKVTF